MATLAQNDFHLVNFLRRADTLVLPGREFGGFGVTKIAFAEAIPLNSK